MKLTKKHILILFAIVTVIGVRAMFPKDTQEQKLVVISVTQDNEVLIDENLTEPKLVHSSLKAILQNEPRSKVIVSVHDDSNSKLYIDIIRQVDRVADDYVISSQDIDLETFSYGIILAN